MSQIGPYSLFFEKLTAVTDCLFHVMIENVMKCYKLGLKTVHRSDDMEAPH